MDVLLIFAIITVVLVAILGFFIYFLAISQDRGFEVAIDLLESQRVRQNSMEEKIRLMEVRIKRYADSGFTKLENKMESIKHI